MIPFEVGMTLRKAFEEEALRDFLASDEEAAEIWEMALKLEGITVVLVMPVGWLLRQPLTDFSPISCDEDGRGWLLSLTRDDVEAGLVKFDFLGLRTTIIKWALENINRDRASSMSGARY